MEWNIKTIGLLAALFFVGYFIGLIEAAIRQRRKDKIKPLPVIPPNLQPMNDERANLLKLRRDTSDSLIVEVNGVTYNKAGELSPESSQSLVRLLIELRPWIEQRNSQQNTPSDKEISKASSNLSKPPQKNKPNDEQTIEAQNIGMVSQIDEILQNRITTSPYAKEGVRLIESETGSVLVYVGLKKFEGIASVPDPKIKALIQEAVREWEEKS